jgi:hypothetical protein
MGTISTLFNILEERGYVLQTNNFTHVGEGQHRAPLWTLIKPPKKQEDFSTTTGTSSKEKKEKEAEAKELPRKKPRSINK